MNSMKEAVSLTEMDSTSSSQEAKKQIPVWSVLAINYWDPRSFDSVEDVRLVWGPQWVQESSQEDEDVVKADIPYSSFREPWWVVEAPRKVRIYFGRVQEKAQRFGNEIACNHLKQHGVTWLRWTSHLTTRKIDFLPAIINITHDLHHVCFSISTWHSRNCTGTRTKVTTTMSKGVAGHCREHNVVKEDDSFLVDLRVHRLSQDRIYKDE